MKPVLLSIATVFLLPLCLTALDPVPPTAVGVVGIDLDTGDVLWEAWQQEAVPEAFRPLTADALFDESKYARSREFRPPRPKFGLPATSGDWSIAMQETSRGYLPDEIVLIRSQDGKSIAEKKLENVGFCVNALGDHFYYVHPSGTLQVFRIALDEGDDPWKPVREVELVERLPGDADFRDHAHVRLFVQGGRVYMQIPEQLYCFEQDGTLVWRTSTAGFSAGGGYSEPSHLHFTTKRVYIQDSRGVSPIELADGRMGWKAPLHLGIYPDSCALFPADQGVGIFSSEYYHEFGFPFAATFASQPPEDPDGFGPRPSDPPQFTDGDSEKFLSYIGELEAFGSRAMQVLLRENIDDPRAVPPQLREQVRALVADDWPEFRSEKRRTEHFATGLVEKGDPGFDRVRAWKRFVPWESANLHLTKDPEFEQGKNADYLAAEVLLPGWPARFRHSHYPLADEAPVALLSEARQTVATARGLEKYLAACLLISHCDIPGGATTDEAEAWFTGKDLGLRALAAPAVAYFSDRKQLVTRILQEPSQALRKPLYRSLAVKPGGVLSDAEIDLWQTVAAEEIPSYDKPSFIAVMRESRDGKIPGKLEQALRPALVKRIDAASNYDEAFPAILHLDVFRNPADDELLATTRKRLGESYDMDRILYRRAQRDSGETP